MREGPGVKTPAETTLGHTSRGDMLAVERNHRDVSENFTEYVDGVMNRALDELDRLSASMMTKAEAHPGLTSDSSGSPLPAKSLRPASKKVRHPSMPAPSITPPSETRVWIIGDHYAEMTTALLAIGVAAANIRFWHVRRSSYSPELLKE